jgi:hypothetical protein
MHMSASTKNNVAASDLHGHKWASAFVQGKRGGQGSPNGDGGVGRSRADLLQNAAGGLERREGEALTRENPTETQLDAGADAADDVFLLGLDPRVILRLTGVRT